MLRSRIDEDSGWSRDHGIPAKAVRTSVPWTQAHRRVELYAPTEGTDTGLHSERLRRTAFHDTLTRVIPDRCLDVIQSGDEVGLEVERDVECLIARQLHLTWKRAS